MVTVAIQIVLTLFLLMAVGMFFAWKGKFTDEASKLMSFLVVNIGLPAMAINNMLKYYTSQSLVQSAVSVLVPLLTLIFNYLIARLVGKIFKVSKKHIGVFCAMFTFSNSMFIGLPVCIALFGESSVQYAMLYYVAQQFTWWTFGVYGIRHDADPSTKFFSKAGMKKLFSPPLVAFFIGIALVLSGIPVPVFITDTLKYISNIVTALSMFFTGIVLYNIGLKNLKVDKTLILMCVGRFIISPALAYAMHFIIPVSHITLQVFLTQAALPIMSQTAILAKGYGADSEYATKGMMLTTLLSIVFIPLYAYLGTIV